MEYLARTDEILFFLILVIMISTLSSFRKDTSRPKIRARIVPIKVRTMDGAPVDEQSSRR
jgi:hypothetical protein